MMSCKNLRRPRLDARIDYLETEIIFHKPRSFSYQRILTELKELRCERMRRDFHVRQRRYA